MKNLKLILLAASLLSTPLAFADESPAPDQNQEHHGWHHKMTPEQRAAFKACMKQKGIELPPPGERPSGPPSEEMRQAFRECRPQVKAPQPASNNQ